MRTFSHALINVSLGTASKLKRADIIAVACGAVLPDMPLLLLSGVTMLLSPSWDVGMARVHDNYATNPWWIALHNLPHSLVVLTLLSIASYLVIQRSWGRYIFLASISALAHTLIDVFTHATDGPYIFFPVNMWRFQSPVSYWNSTYYGTAFTVVEVSLDVALAIYLFFKFRHATST